MAFKKSWFDASHLLCWRELFGQAQRAVLAFKELFRCEPFGQAQKAVLARAMWSSSKNQSCASHMVKLKELVWCELFRQVQRAGFGVSCFSSTLFWGSEVVLFVREFQPTSITREGQGTTFRSGRPLLCPVLAAINLFQNRPELFNMRCLYPIEPIKSTARMMRRIVEHEIFLSRVTVDLTALTFKSPFPTFRHELSS